MCHITPIILNVPSFIERNGEYRKSLFYLLYIIRVGNVEHGLFFYKVELGVKENHVIRMQLRTKYIALGLYSFTTCIAFFSQIETF